MLLGDVFGLVMLELLLVASISYLHVLRLRWHNIEKLMDEV